MRDLSVRGPSPSPCFTDDEIDAQRRGELLRSHKQYLPWLVSRRVSLGNQIKITLFCESSHIQDKP